MIHLWRRWSQRKFMLVILLLCAALSMSDLLMILPMFLSSRLLMLWLVRNFARWSTRGASSTGSTSQSFDRISIDSGDEDDANVITFMTSVKLVKIETSQDGTTEVEGASTTPSKVSMEAVLTKLNKRKRSVMKKGRNYMGSTQEKVSEKDAGESLQLEKGMKKKERVGSSKPVVEEVEKVIEKGKHVVESEAPDAVPSFFVPKWQVRLINTTRDEFIFQELLMNLATPSEK
ncbi:hypothetical protein HanRHA438_Chr10g0443431 [Helianthus annuus]|nr:hypothetical protein HanRHA438_Chr10g0443431 [Helianthus annuus]